MWGKVKGVAGKVFGKVKAWWKSREQFKTNRGETHTLFFKGSGADARLMIASYEQFFENFLDKAKIPEGEKKIEATGLKNKLMTLSRNKLKPLYTKLRKKELSDKERTDTTKELRSLLREMKVKTKNFYDLIIDPNDPVVPKAKNEFQSIVTERNNELKSKNNAGKIDEIAKFYRLSPEQRRKASKEYWFARVMYGVILEKMVAEKLSNQRNKFGYMAGAGQPDFIGRGEYTNLFFDVTTNKAEDDHKRRVYGDRLIMGLYTGPARLGLFPYREEQK